MQLYSSFIQFATISLGHAQSIRISNSYEVPGLNNEHFLLRFKPTHFLLDLSSVASPF